MNDFTASNGIPVSVSSQGVISLGVNEMLHAPEAEALREFFQAEADERLGIWRSKFDPSWTGILDGAVDADQTIVRFQNADHARSFHISRSGGNLHRWSSDLQAVAREWLDAHPEPKPWHEAKPGDVWEFTYVRPGYDQFMQPIEREFVGLFVRADGGWRTVARKRSYLDESIVRSAKPIWSPEVAS